MYAGKVDVMLPPSIFFFARNVRVTAPDMSVAYKRPPDQTATAVPLPGPTFDPQAEPCARSRSVMYV